MQAIRPTERDQELGRALRDARKEAGLRQVEAAKLINSSQATMARIESGVKVPTPEQLDALLERYQPERRAEIERLAGLDSSDSLDLSPKFDTMLRASEQAKAIYTLHSERIPMTLQCERYALKQYSLFDESIEMATVLRMLDRRTKVLSLPSPPPFNAIMSVSSLLRMPGGQDNLIREQALHLLNLLEATPQLTLRVLPMNANIPYFDIDFTLIRARDRRKDKIYVPFGFDGHVITDRAKIEERERYWQLVWEAALTVEKTILLLQELAESDPSTVTGTVVGPDSGRRTM